MRKKLLPTVGRGLWYVCGFILLLSLPTFSYLVPTLQEPVFDGQSSDSSGFVAREESASFGTYQLSGGEGFVRSKSSGFYSRRGYFGSSQKSKTSRSRTVRANRAGTRAERGLNRLRKARGGVTKARAPRVGEAKDSPEASQDTPQGEAGTSELNQMEQAYESTLNYLFPAQSQPYGSGYNNPFQSALNGQGGGGVPDDSQGDQNSPDDGSSGDGDGVDDSGGGSEGDGSPGSDPDDGVDDSDEEPKPYDIMLIGSFGGPEVEETVFRAYQGEDGSYVLEDGSSVSFFSSSGVVGIPQPAFSLAENEMLVSGDFTGDDAEDVVVGGWVYPTSFIRGFVRRGNISPDPDFEAILQFVKVRSLAIYDFESDGTDELAVLFAGNPSLVIYRIEGDQIKYLREMPVPFEPSLLVGTQDQGVFKQRYLQVLDKTLQRSIVFSSLFPGAYSFSKPSSFKSTKLITLDPPDEASQGDQFSILRYDDVIVVVEQSTDELVFIASFTYAQGYPKLAVGRSAEDGSRQVLFVPKR